MPIVKVIEASPCTLSRVEPQQSIREIRVFLKQRPLPDDALQIVATGEKEDPAPAT
jgi:hypothetical protein